MVISIIRANYVSTISFTNGTWVNSFGAIWSVVETCLAIVSACVPTLRPLYEKVFGKTGDTQAGLSGGQSGYVDASKGSYKMQSFGTKSAKNITSLSVTNYKEEDARSFTRLRDNAA